MIPNIKATLSPYDNRTIDLNVDISDTSSVPAEIVLWLKHKVERHYLGEAMVPGVISSMNGFVQQQLHALVNRGYIHNIKNEWVINKPLFIWIRGQ